MRKEDFKRTLRNLKENTYEYNKVLAAIRAYTPKDGAILDVGCGYGQYLKPLSNVYKEVQGVDANKYIRETLTKDGLAVISPEEFGKGSKKYDTILMSHIIEHFHPEDLLEMMDFYLKSLKEGGHLVIATPTLTETFYIDFDHKRPYYPQSIEEVFDGKKQQVVTYSRNTLKTVKVWYRRSRLQIFKTSLLFNNPMTKDICTGLNIILAVLFKYSFQIIGYRSGWIGVFRKTKS